MLTKNIIIYNQPSCMGGQFSEMIDESISFSCRRLRIDLCSSLQPLQYCEELMLLPGTQGIILNLLQLKQCENMFGRCENSVM